MDQSRLGRFHVAPGFSPAAPETWVWEDRSADVNAAEPITITGGRSDEVTQVDAGGARLQVDNAGGHYCTENPLGRWYGRLTKGCPARWGVISGAAAFATNATNGWGSPDVGASWDLEGTLSSWSASGGAGLRAFTTANIAAAATLVGADARNGDATIVFSSPVVTTGGAVRVSIMARRAGPGDNLLFAIDLEPAGVVSARIIRDKAGFNILATAASAGFTYSAGQRLKMRAVWDGPALRLRVWPEANPEPATWTATASDAVLTGAGVGVHLWRLGSNTNVGTLTLSVDDFEVQAVEVVGTVPAWPVSWDPTGQQSWSTIEIAGPMRRLGQGDEALMSPIARQLLRYNPQAYWPLEDGSEATAASSAVAKGTTANVVGGTFGQGDCPPGASAAVSLATVGGSWISGRVARWTINQSGYAAMCYLRLPVNAPAIAVPLMEVTSMGMVTRWQVDIDASNIYCGGYDASGTQLTFKSGTTSNINVTRWFALQLEVEETVGGFYQWSLIWHQVGSTAWYSIFDTALAGSADRATGMTVTAAVADQLVDHMWIGSHTLPFVDTTFMNVSTGYAGELASDRVARLCAEEGVLATVEPGTSEQLGTQKIGSFLDLLRAAEAADMGVLYEAGAYIGYRPRRARYRQPVWMTLAIGADGDIADPGPEPIDDDLRLRNAWTVSRELGGSATAQSDASIAMSDRRPDSVTINVLDQLRLDNHASWRVHLGTRVGYRWPGLPVMFTDRASQLALWRGRPFGMRIRLTGVPSQGPIGRDPELIVEGFSQEITSDSWTVVLNCSPAELWDVGIYDDAASRYDSASTTLVGAQTSSSTSWAITTVNQKDAWSTTTPYTWRVAGEVVTVTNMTAPAGAGPYTQTATVIRAVNGITKAQLANTAIRLAFPIVYAL